MDKNIVLKLADSLHNTANAFEAVANSFADTKVEPAFAEKVCLIVEKLELKETARRINVYVSTVKRWLNGGPALKKNRLQIEALYKVLNQ